MKFYTLVDIDGTDYVVRVSVMPDGQRDVAAGFISPEDKDASGQFWFEVDENLVFEGPVLACSRMFIAWAPKPLDTNDGM